MTIEFFYKIDIIVAGGMATQVVKEPTGRQPASSTEWPAIYALLLLSPNTVLSSSL